MSCFFGNQFAHGNCYLKRSIFFILCTCFFFFFFFFLLCYLLTRLATSRLISVFFMKTILQYLYFNEVFHPEASLFLYFYHVELAHNYCLHTIFQKLHFSKSHFSETPQEKYDYVIFLQPKSPKKCRKNFENRFTIEIIMPKKYFE